MVFSDAEKMDRSLHRKHADWSALEKAKFALTEEINHLMSVRNKVTSEMKSRNPNYDT